MTTNNPDNSANTNPSQFVTQLPYLTDKPKATGNLRTEFADFKVHELLPFAPSGEGEHLMIHIEKLGANTLYVARQLAKYFSVAEKHVSYAGLKDRAAQTQQWFSVHLPGKQAYDLADCDIEGVKIISFARHHKKLKTGALLGNRFELTLRNVSNIDEAISRFEQVIKQGVPNYFGEQRFGINGGNLARAQALFGGQKVKDKKKRGFYLSAVRSYIFNLIVAKRIENNEFFSPIDGDVFMLAGSQSVFAGQASDTDLNERLAALDIDITAPMWGAGELMTSNGAKQLETTVAEQHNDFCRGLAKFGLKQERRKIRLNISQGKYVKKAEDKLVLSFILPSGSYATTVLREVIDYQDVSERQIPEQKG